MIETQDQLVKDLEEKIKDNSCRDTSPSSEKPEEDPLEKPSAIVPQPQPQPDTSSAIVNPVIQPQESIMNGNSLSEQCRTLQAKVLALEEANSTLQVWLKR